MLVGDTAHRGKGICTGMVKALLKIAFDQMKLHRIAAWSAATLALLLVFAAYLQPEVAFTLANQLWNCF